MPDGSAAAGSARAGRLAGARLRTLGFGKVIIGVDDVLTFVAHKPAPAAAGCGS